MKWEDIVPEMEFHYLSGNDKHIGITESLWAAHTDVWEMERIGEDSQPLYMHRHAFNAGQWTYIAKRETVNNLDALIEID